VPLYNKLLNNKEEYEMLLNENIIDIKEASNLLGVYHTTIRKMIKRHEAIKMKNPDELSDEDKKFVCVPYGRMGSKIIFSREKIMNFKKELTESM
jgi:DUF917 family protein